MNTKINNVLLCFVALLMSSQVIAATVQISPANIITMPNEPFSLLLQGIDFSATNGGGFSLSWDQNALSLTSREFEIQNNMSSNGFIVNNVLITPGQLDVTISTFVADPFFINTGPVSGNFDIATLEFTALIQLGDTDVSFITTQPAWVDENNVDLAPALQPNYVGASITITTASGTLPVPAAVWLFGSGLIGLIGFARRKVRV